MAIKVLLLQFLWQKQAYLLMNFALLDQQLVTWGPWVLGDHNGSNRALQATLNISENLI